MVVAIVATALALVPVACVLLFHAGRHYLPIGDEAIIDMRVRDVFTSHTPLVGAYSRGFNHPGPLLYWLLAPLSAITGHAPWSIMVSGALLQGIAIAGSAWLAFRRGGMFLCLSVLAALGLAYSSFVYGSQFLQAWNPNIAFPFFMLFLLQAWSLALGSRWQLLGVVVTGTLLVQLHVGYVPLVVAAILWAVVIVVLDHRRGRVADALGGQPEWRRVLSLSGVAVVVLWIPVVVQQLTEARGNLSALYDYFGSSHAVAGLDTGIGLFAAEFRIPPPWLGGNDHVDFFDATVAGASWWWLLVPVALLGLGFYAAHRSERVADRRMLQLATLSSVVSIVAMARISVLMQPFLFYWRVISAVFLVVAVSWAVIGWSRVQDHSRRYVAAVALVMVVAVFFGARAWDDVLHDDATFSTVPANVEHLLGQLHDAGLPTHPVLMRGIGTTTGGLAQSLFDDLDRSGVPVRVDAKWGFEYGTQRTTDTSHVDDVWYVSGSGSDLSLLDDYPSGRLLASVTPLDGRSERELRQAQRSVRAQLRAAHRRDLERLLDSPLFGFVMQRAKVPGVSQTDADRIAALNGRVERADGCRCSVLAFPAATAPRVPYSMGF
jgi:hypothetical protein